MRAIALIIAALGWAIFQDAGSPSGWQSLNIGGGGYMTGGCIANDGTIYGRTDSYGGYVKTGSNRWAQFVTPSTMPAASVIPGNSYGVYEVACSATNSAIAYFMYNGSLFYSTNANCTTTSGLITTSCATWTLQSAFSALSNVSANVGGRLYGRYMAVDPNNNGIVLIGSKSEGTFLCTSCNTNSATVTQLSASLTNSSSSGITNVAFDPKSTTSGGASQDMVACPSDHGVWISTNGGTTWTHSVSGPASCQHVVYSPIGELWITDFTTGTQSLWKYSCASPPCGTGGTWTNYTIGSTANIQTVAIDPSNCTSTSACNVFGIGSQSLSGSSYVFSTNDGGTWQSQLNPTYGILSTDVPWQACASPCADNVTMADAIFDTSGNTWFFTGVGSMKAALPVTTSTSYNFTTEFQGTEQVVGRWAISPPGGNPVFLSEDFAEWYNLQKASTSTYPTGFCPGSFEEATSVDYATANPSTIVFLGNPSQISTSGGQAGTCSNFAHNLFTGSVGGAIAASSTTAMVAVDGNGGGIYCGSPSGGWTKQTIGSNSDASWTGSNHFKNVAADRVNATTFYAYNPTNGGLWVTTDNCSSWHQVLTGVQMVPIGSDSVIKSAFGVAGRVYWSQGGPLSGPAGSNTGFEIDVNLSAFTATITGIANMFWSMDSGAPDGSHGSEPCFYFYGWLTTTSSTFGEYRTCDHNSTFTKLNNGFVLSLDAVDDIGADSNVYGRLYHVKGGSGFECLNC